MSLYRREVLVAGVPVRCDPVVRGWNGWPESVREVLRRWNKAGRLSFYAMDSWYALATGFAKPSMKCVECGAFFNNSGTTACWLRNGSKQHGRWVCDDCIVQLAEAA